MVRALALGVALAVAAPDALADPPDVAGVIILVDKEHARLHVAATTGQEYWFVCRPETKVTIRGYAAWFDDLRTEYKVRVEFDPLTGEALRIDAMP